MTDRKIIGYVPIYEPQPGAITTQAFILCSKCMKAISAHGGPRHEALCLDCVLGAAPRIAVTKALRNDG